MSEGKSATFTGDEQAFKVQTNVFTETTVMETPQPTEPLQVRWKKALVNIHSSGETSVRRLETQGAEHYYYCVKRIQNTMSKPGETYTEILAINENLAPVILAVSVKNTQAFGPQMETIVKPCPSGQGMSDADIQRLATQVVGGDF